MSVYSPLPYLGNGVGIRTAYATLLPPGGRVVAYVGKSGVPVNAYGDLAHSGLLVQTLNAGLAMCTGNDGDTVVILPGHTESISVADQMSALVAGTKIIAAGDNLFTFDTATTATFLVDVDNVVLDGLKFDFTGIDNLAAPITVTGANCRIINCEAVVASATEGCVRGITVSTGANGFKFMYNRFHSVGEADPQTNAIVSIDAAVNNVVIEGNYISAATPGDTVGLIDVTAAATNVTIKDNSLLQLESTDASDAIVIADVAATGMVTSNRIRLSEDNTPNASGLAIGSSAVFGAYNNLCTSANASGVLSPTVDT
jgi:hypothetical protein